MADLERNGNHEHLSEGMDSDAALRKIRTAGSISISPDLFEKLYLGPQTQVKGDLRKTFGNPTPIALVGFLLCLSPLSCDLLGWRGAGGLGAVDNGAYFGFGFVLMFFGGIMEFFLGNTFPAVVFTSFSGFWFTFGGFLVPGFGSTLGYPKGAMGPEYAASLSFFLLSMGLLCLVYLVAALRTNMIFVIIFFTLVLAFSFLAGSFWQTAQNNTVVAAQLLTGGGACAFAVCAFGWYLFFVQVLAAVDFPLALPVGDLSTMIKGASERKRA